MLDTFGMQQGGAQYRRLVAAFQRIFGATIFFGTDTQRQKAIVVHQARFSFMSEARIWYSRNSDQETLPYEFQNEIVLSGEFFREILAHPIPTDNGGGKGAVVFAGGSRSLHVAFLQMLHCKRPRTSTVVW